MTKENIMQELYISETDTKDAIKVKLLLAAILSQNMENVGIIMDRYQKMVDIMQIE